jgi:lipoprotein-anchoring transpeptidase ErfK/SrfK
MTDENRVERLLGDAFAARAHSAVREDRPVPHFEPDHDTGPGALPPSHHRRTVRWLAPLAAAAAVIAVVAAALVLHGSNAHQKQTPAARLGVTAAFAQADGATYGVGEPIVVTFDHAITDAKPFVKASSVAVDGTHAHGAWYFLKNAAGGLEAHYRLQDYWPAHATVTVRLRLQDVAAGAGLVFTDNAALSFHTGAAHISRVDGATHHMQVSVDGKLARTIAVSVGARGANTLSGTKIVLGKQQTGRLTKKGKYGYSEVIHDLVRLTTSGAPSPTGEYVLAAPFDLFAQGKLNVSQGGTDMSPANAQWFFGISRPGDVVTYTNTGGKTVGLTNGFGDWNVPWSTWQSGGILATH